jgi:serine/threonine protein kinase
LCYNLNMSAGPADVPALVGRYRISAHLASSVIDDLYKGFDPLIERPVVVRVFRLRLSDPAAESAIKRTFYEEMQRAGALMHAGIVLLYDAGEFPGGLFMAGEFLEATSLSSLLEGGLDRDIRLRVSLLEQMTDALEYARERGFPHLHLRPSSVLVGADLNVKVGGFGVARVVDALTAASGGSAAASSRYAAPERARGDPGDPRSDVYSLARIALDLLAEPSVPPSSEFTPSADTIPAPTPEVAALGVNPNRWAALFDRACSPDPADRFETPGELEMELLTMLGLGVSGARAAREAADDNIFLPAPPAKAPQGGRTDEDRAVLPTESATTRAAGPPPDPDQADAETTPGRPPAR